MNFENMFIMQGMLFALMLIGLLLKRTGLITDGNRGLLSGLVVNVTLPCSIIKSFEMEFDMEILRSCLAILLVALAIQVGAYILSLVLCLYILSPMFFPNIFCVPQYYFINYCRNCYQSRG